MNDLQLELTRLIGRKDLSFGCILQKNKHWSNSDEPLVGRVTSDPSGFDTGYQMGFNSDHMGTYSTTVFGTYVLNDKNEDGTKKWEIIGHPATLSDLHMWINKSFLDFKQDYISITIEGTHRKGSGFGEFTERIQYDSTRYLIEQDESTLQTIINLINTHG